MTNDITRRYRRLILEQRFLGLATYGAEGPWACNINFVVEDPQAPTLVFYSAASSRHARDIRETGVAAATIYSAEPDAAPDGIQILAGAAEVPEGEVPAVHELYFERNFADPETRKEWMIPVESYVGTGSRRFFRLSLTDVWIIDTDAWIRDKVDRRTRVPDLSLA